MIEGYNGGPVGIRTLAANIGEDMETIESLYEPYLLQAGFIHRTQKGRTAAKLAYDHLGIQYSEDEQLTFK